MGVMETNVEGFWIAVQRAKGSPAATPTRHLRKVGGDVDFARTDGSQKYSDLDMFGDAQDFVDVVIGNGNPAIQATPSDLAFLLWLFYGQETVAVIGAGPDQRHTFDTFGIPKWFTCWKQVGEEVSLRQKFADCRISSLEVVAAAGQKIYQVTPTFISLAGGEFSTDDWSSVAQSSEDAFLFTEGEGGYLVDTIALPISQFQITLDRALSPVQGDGPSPIDLAPGNAAINCQAQMTLNEDGLEQYNREIYGTPTPAARAQPIRTIPPLGSLRGTVTRSGTRAMVAEVAGVKWSPTIPLAGSAEGGPAEMTLQGQMRKVAGRPAASFVISNGDAAYT